MLKTKSIARHGDLNISSTSKTNKSTKAVDSFILAEGEATGHFHKLTAVKGGSILVVDGDTSYFEVVGGAVLDHPEHGKIKLEPNTYKVTRERERDPYLNAIRQVRD